MESSPIPLPRDPRWRHVVVLGVFLGLLYLFRHLAPLFICFIILERSLGWSSDFIQKKTKLHRKAAIGGLLALAFGAIGLIGFLLVKRAMPYLQAARTDGRAYLESLAHNATVARIRQMAGFEGNSEVLESIKEHAAAALGYATATAHVALNLLIGFVIALIYLFEREEIDAWFDELPPASLSGTLTRWFGYVGDAIAVTVRMQVVVAVFNAMITLPVLLVLRLPNVPALFLLCVLTGLMPVVGTVISGAVLSFVAYDTHGAWAVGVFLFTTFLLHKIESYYLSPRLAAKHVRLPGLLLVLSLVLFEHVFGFVGIFLSFPALYVSMRISKEWKDAVEANKTPRAAAGAAE